MEQNQQTGAEERMEDFSDQKKRTQLLSRPKGGLKTLPFIIGNEALENVATYGLQPNMILYLMSGYNMPASTGTSVTLLWSASSNFLPILGAFLADSYLGRFRVIAFGSIASFLGMTLLWLTTLVPEARPSHCNTSSQSCESASTAQLALLFSSFVLMAIGCGGIRPCSITFGADQLRKEDDPRSERVLSSYFNCYYVSMAISTLLAITVVVYIQDHMGWIVGFGVPPLLMFFSVIFFWMGSSFYVKLNPNKSLFIGFAQVLVVALKNRNLAFPPTKSDRWYHHKDSRLVAPTDKLRCLNKACIIRDPEKDSSLDSSTSGSWNLCTVDQVEEFKSLIKIMPLWSTGIIVSATTLTPFGVLQAKTMDRHITSNFEIPAGSFSMFVLVTLSIWVAIYDRIIVPQLAKFTGRPRGLSYTQRMGIGLLLSFMAMAVSALVESVRLRTAVQEGFSDNPDAVIGMSAMWLVPQHCIIGIAEAFFAIGQIEFFYSQLPRNISTMGMALFSVGMGIGNLVGSLIMEIVDDATKGGGKESWVSSNPNQGHYDYYYWLLTILSLVNFLYFLVCSWAYGPCDEEGTRVVDDGECYTILESCNDD